MDVEDVISNIEVRVVLPGGVGDAERDEAHALSIAGNERHTRSYLLLERLERYLAFVYGQGADMQRRVGPF